MRRGRVTCAFCGRDLSDEPDAIKAGGLAFCSQSHLLDYEARPRHQSHGGGRLAGLGVLVVVIAGWRDPGTPRPMICLESRTVAGSSVRFAVMNEIPDAVSTKRPQAFEPWELDFTDANSCIAHDPLVGTAKGAAPVLEYFCGGNCGPAARVDRSQPVWTVQCSGTATRARITDAWFSRP